MTKQKGEKLSKQKSEVIFTKGWKWKSEESEK